MRILLTTIAALAATCAFSACSGPQSIGAPGVAGSGSLTQPAHRVKADVTSTTVQIKNASSQEISLKSLTNVCLTGSPPSPVAANSTSSTFTVSYTSGCVGDPVFNMTYGPSSGGSAADNCTFNISFATPAGPFSFSVTNGSDTNCTYTPLLSGTNQFTYSHV